MVGRLCTVFDAAVVLPRPCGLNLRSSEKFISQKSNHLLNLGCLTKQGHTNALYSMYCLKVDTLDYYLILVFWWTAGLIWNFLFLRLPPPPQRTACGHVLSLVAAHLETAVSRRLARCRIRPWDLTLGQHQMILGQQSWLFNVRNATEYFCQWTHTQG